MPHHIIEFKARVPDLAPARAWLQAQQARLQGTDEQTDTYFSIPTGRLKLRQGPIENSLIQYNRPEQQGLKYSTVTMTLLDAATAASLRLPLTAALPVLVVVRKTREIWWIGNVKIHLDTVDGLGTFVEVEAIDFDGSLGLDHLTQQAADARAALAISDDALVAASYSDLLIGTQG